MFFKHKWRVAIAATVVIAVLLLYAPILQGLAELLIVDQPADDYTAVCVRAWNLSPDGDRSYDEAADFYGAKPGCKVLLLAPQPDRLFEIDVVPSFESLSRRELGKRRVPQDAISAIPGGGYHDRDAARSLAVWLKEHPNDTVILLCSQFRSEQMRRALDDALDPNQAARVRVRALADYKFNETNWWKYRSGYKMFGVCWLMRIYLGFGGGYGEQPPYSKADDYERDFLCSQDVGAAVEKDVGVAVELPPQPLPTQQKQSSEERTP